MNSTAGPQVSAPELPSDVQRLIRSEQERGYRNLALKLGLGADPKKAYEHLSGTPVSSESHLPYEDPQRYQIAAIIAGAIQKAIAASGGSPLDPAPVFATLPSGNVSAQVRIESQTRVPVIFIEQGLFRFLYDFCHLIGWAVPPMTGLHLAQDTAMLEMANQYTMPFDASNSFVRSMGSYAFEGTPLGRAAQGVAQPEHNLQLSIVLLTLMERFVMAHEMAHIKMGHLTDAPADGTEVPGGDQEYQADSAGMGLVLYMTSRENLSFGIGYWACELALVAMNLLYRSIQIGEFGAGRVSWIDESHPDPLRRREQLRQVWLEPSLPEEGIAAARMLCGMSDALIQRLWEMASFALLEAHQRGERPSPMWRDLIDTTFMGLAAQEEHS